MDSDRPPRAGRASAPPAGSDRVTRPALAQLPPLAIAWLLHAAAILYLFFRFAPADRIAVGVRVGILSALALLVLLEVALLGLVNCALELAARRSPRRRLVDAAKALLFALPLATLLTSTLKFALTGTHLNRSELWFVRTGARQLLSESTAGEIVGLLALPTLALALAAGLWPALRRARRRQATTTPRQLVLLAAATGVGLALVLAVSPGARFFAATFVPETHWLAAALPGAPAPPDTLAAHSEGEPIGPYEPPAPQSRPDVVLVMLESVPWSRTSLAEGPAAATPVLANLVREATVFSRAYTVSTHSDYAQMAVLSSLYPRKYAFHDYYTALDYPRTLIWDVLSAAGWATGMFSCQNETWGNMIAYLRTPGLDRLRHSPDWPDAPRRGSGSESKVFEETPVRAWREWLREIGDRPYFAYLNFQATHFPYEVPEGASRPFTPWEIDFAATFVSYPQAKVPLMLNRFFNALHYSDRWLGEIVATLRERGRWDRTILVVVSDHGEAFYEHGLPTHGTSLLEEEVRSLLLVRDPGRPPSTVHEPVSLLDVAPTLLAVLGMPPHGNFQGRSDILDPAYSAAGRPLHFTIQGMTHEDGVLLDGWKYLVNPARRLRLLFDLSSDPAEQVNLLAARPDKATALEAERRRLLSSQLDYYAARRWENGRYPPPLP